ncbi:MAG: double-strand break repair helicase AddA [Methylobacteriaceae bacterium]|nr:double-strand break repair helicase AddA [Methylobacteriaceae bacterium]
MSRAVPDRVRDAQLRASDPRRSAWVSAHAGSGKTYVLTQRVVRLLLAGVAPARILCLTYTKAAAANMAGRIFDTLRDWTRLDDAGLTKALEATTGARPDAAALRRARTLFARAVETPGGLKVQTIHAFCEALLHRFPFEANAPANFAIAETLQETELLRLAIADALTGAARDAALGAAVADLARDMARDTFDRLLREVAKQRDHLAALFEEFGAPEAYAATLARQLGVGEDETFADVDRDIETQGLFEQRAFLADRVEATAGAGADMLQHLRASIVDADLSQARQSYMRAFLTAKDKVRDTLLVQKAARAEPALEAALRAEGERLAALMARRRKLALVVRTRAFMRLARAILVAYAERKRQAGVLDFADLILRVEALLARSSGAWVMYKLDQGVDHILVDEAQDTAPAQWRIVLKLAEEFFAGAGRPGPARTLFAVGDEKQSIYSFQGAAPHMFDEMRRLVARRYDALGETARFETVPLVMSFRSTPGVLEAVDAVFADPADRRGLTSVDETMPPHESWKRDLPGSVEIWPTILAPKSVKKDESAPWTPGPPAAGPGAPPLILAGRIAERIAASLAPGSPDRVHDGATPRPVRPGDIMILVRSRGAIFEAVIRALKVRGVPVAGADRVRLAEHLAVLDLVALGRAALSPADDLALACALKSPLFGCDDDDLIALAPGRAGSLAEALAGASETRLVEAAARFARWRAMALGLGPFGFYARLLGPDGARRAFVERLGPEAGDVLDEFLALALEHEQTTAPSLAAFLAAIEAGEVEIKREGETEDVVRVMTIHAAKGLEAKIVILPDMAGPAYDGRKAPRLISAPRRAAPAGAAPFLIVAPNKDDSDEFTLEARGAHREAGEAEHRRLLYVALTRAEEQVIVASCASGDAPPANSWAAVVLRALEKEGRLVARPAFWSAEETIWRREVGEIGPAPPQSAPDAAPAPAPDWLNRPALPESAPRRLAPSTLAPTVSGPAGVAARARGRRLHAWIDRLAAIAPPARAAALAGAAPDDAGLAAQAAAIVASPALAPLFGPGARAEAALRGALADGVVVSGRVDRLAVTPEAVWIAEFKSGAGADAPAYAPQLRLYRRLLAPLFPDKPLRSLLVFAQGPVIVEIADDPAP